MPGHLHHILFIIAERKLVDGIIRISIFVLAIPASNFHQINILHAFEVVPDGSVCYRFLAIFLKLFVDDIGHLPDTVPPWRTKQLVQDFKPLVVVLVDGHPSFSLSHQFT